MTLSVFPTELDDISNPIPALPGQFVWEDGSIRDGLDDGANIIVPADPKLLHEYQHGLANDAIEALEQKMGEDGSTDPTTIDYRLRLIEGELFPFTITTFTSNIGGGLQRIGTTDPWKAAGAITFQEAYANATVTDAYITHTGWANLVPGGVGFDQPTPSVEAENYPVSPGSTKTWTLHATDGVTALTASISTTFVNDRFWGSTTTTGDLGDLFDSADILALANSELSNTLVKVGISFTSSAGQYGLYAYPKREGPANTVALNGFAGSWLGPYTVSVTTIDGYTEDYYAYRTLNQGLGSYTGSFT